MGNAFIEKIPYTAIRAGVVKIKKLEKTPKLLPIPNSQFPIPKKPQDFGHESAEDCYMFELFQ
jgi:hypothetical protein